MRAELEKRINRCFTLTPAVIGFSNVLLIVTLIVLGWPEWWRNINYETSPLNWFSSMQLALIGATAFLVFSTSFLCLNEPRQKRLLWMLLAFAFFYFSIDEQFQIHERLREFVFKPHHIGTNLPGIAPGDFLLVFYAIVGLCVASVLVGSLRACRPSLYWFFAAVCIAAVAVGLDAADWSSRSNRVQRTEQFIEEIGETLAEMSFLISFVLFYFSKLKKVLLEKA